MSEGGGGDVSWAVPALAQAQLISLKTVSFNLGEQTC